MVVRKLVGLEEEDRTFLVCRDVRKLVGLEEEERTFLVS